MLCDSSWRLNRSLPGGLHHLVPGLVRRRGLGPPLGIVSRIQPVQYQSVRLQPGLEPLLELPGFPWHLPGKIALLTDVPGQIVELDPRRIVLPDQLEVAGPNGRPGLACHGSNSENRGFPVGPPNLLEGFDDIAHGGSLPHQLDGHRQDVLRIIPRHCLEPL